MADGCPFCGLLRGEETDWNGAADVVWRDESTTAFVSPRWWSRNEGHVIVIPNEHVRDIAAIDEATLGLVYATAKRVAAALVDTYECEGSSMRQHNGAGAGQDVWHFHVHVFPRWAGDDLYARDAEYRFAGADERRPYAERLRSRLGSPERPAAR